MASRQIELVVPVIGVGLLNASMTIYDAWCDRAPVLIIGGTGPLDSTRRRGAVDWQHTANVPRHKEVSPGVVRSTIERLACLPEGWLQ